MLQRYHRIKPKHPAQILAFQILRSPMYEVIAEDALAVSAALGIPVDQTMMPGCGWRPTEILTIHERDFPAIEAAGLMLAPIRNEVTR